MSNKLFWILIIVIALVVAGIWLLRSGVEAPTLPEPSAPVAEEPTAPAEPGIPELGVDDIASIQEQLEGINLGDLESEFEQIDQDLQEL